MASVLNGSRGSGFGVFFCRKKEGNSTAQRKSNQKPPRDFVSLRLISCSLCCGNSSTVILAGICFVLCFQCQFLEAFQRESWSLNLSRFQSKAPWHAIKSHSDRGPGTARETHRRKPERKHFNIELWLMLNGEFWYCCHCRDWPQDSSARALYIYIEKSFLRTDFSSRPGGAQRRRRAEVLRTILNWNEMMIRWCCEEA